MELQSDLYYAATLGTLKTSRLTEVGRLIEVQYKFGRNGSQRDFIDFISSNMVVKKCTKYVIIKN